MADDPQVTFDDFDQAAKVDSLRRSNQRLKSELKVTQDHVERLTGRLAVLEGIDRLDPKPPRWLTPKKPRSTSATVVAILSDCHFDEQVRPEDVAGVNQYDRTIATRRLQSWCQQLARLPQDGPSADVPPHACGARVCDGPARVALRRTRDGDDDAAPRSTWTRFGFRRRSDRVASARAGRFRA